MVMYSLLMPAISSTRLRHFLRGACIRGGCLLLWGCASLVAGAGRAENSWTRFRGPNGTGVSDATTIPVAWTDKDYNWVVDLPGVGHSSPVAWGERIFVTCGDPKTAERTLFCLHIDDGRTLWRRDFPSHVYGQHASSCYATATPAVDAQGVVATWTTPEAVVLIAHDLDGEETWRRELGPYVGMNGSGASPILVDDLVVLTNEQDDGRFLSRLSTGTENPNAPVGKSSILAVDRTTGLTRWELPRTTVLASYSTPCVRTTPAGNRELILTGTAHGVTGVDLGTGEVRWEIPDVFPERCVGSPVLAGDLVVAGFGRGVHGVTCVAARAGKSGRGDATTLAYQVDKSVPLVPTPVAYQGMLFLWADTGVVTCLDAASGELQWRERVGGDFYSSPICVNGRLYGIAKNGDVTVIAAARVFEVLARSSLGADCYATPAVAQGTMLIRTHSKLFSLGGARR